MKASVRGGIKNVVNSGSKKRKTAKRREDTSSNDDESAAADVKNDSANQEEVGPQSSSSSSSSEEDEWGENESSDEDALAVAEAAAQVCNWAHGIVLIGVAQRAHTTRSKQLFLELISAGIFSGVDGNVIHTCTMNYHQVAEVQKKNGLSRSEARARARDEAFKVRSACPAILSTPFCGLPESTFFCDIVEVYAECMSAEKARLSAQ